MLKKFSLRTKLQLVLVGMSVVALTLLGLEARQGGTALQSGKEAQVRGASESIIDKIDRNLFERYGDVQAYALSEAARSGDRARIEAFIADMMVTYAPVYDLMMVTDSNGYLLAASTVDKTGKPIDVGFLRGKNFSNTPWFKAAARGEIQPGQSFVEDLHVDADVARIFGSSGRVMNFSAPIRDKHNGKIIGVWTNRMSWADVVEAIVKEEVDKLKHGRITHVFPYMVDARGRYLLHPEGQAYELKESLEGFVPRKAGTHPESATAIRDLKTTGFEGDVIEIASPSRGYASYPGRGWTFLLQAPLADSQTTFNTWLFVAAVVIQILGNIFGARIVNGISRVFETVISELQQDSARVGSAATEITQASQDLAQASTKQAAALQETAASIEQMSAMIRKSAENANSSQGVAQSCNQTSTEGRQMVRDVIEAIEKINQSNTRIMDQVDEGNQQLSDIVRLISEIGDKTRVINDIVFQTKLLSFNASVEAARAGEHGKGFAVVAEEVGNLAAMSGNAAKEISSMLEGSIQKVEGIVTQTKSKVASLITDGKAKVEAGRETATRCGESIDKVVSLVEEVNRMIGEIAVATKEQAQGVTEISKAMSQLDQVTHANNSTSQSIHQSAEQLASQASSLDSLVGTLNSAVHGSDASHAPGAPPSHPEPDSTTHDTPHTAHAA